MKVRFHTVFVCGSHVNTRPKLHHLVHAISANKVQSCQLCHGTRHLCYDLTMGSILHMTKDQLHLHHTLQVTTRVIPKVMSNFFLHANWEQQTKESAAVDGTSCCVILECLVMSIACIT